MYVYFDKLGNLKEIINDTIARVGDSNYHKIYCYWEGQTSAVLNVDITYTLPDGRKVFNLAIGQTKTIQLKHSDFEKPRDLYYFKYYKDYVCYEFTVPDNVLALTGAVSVDICYNTATDNIHMASAPFVVDGSSDFLPRENIDIAQYNELKRMIQAQDRPEKHYYKHHIEFTTDEFDVADDGYIFTGIFELLTTDETVFTLETLIQYMQDHYDIEGGTSLDLPIALYESNQVDGWQVGSLVVPDMYISWGSGAEDIPFNETYIIAFVDTVLEVE